MEYNIFEYLDPAFVPVAIVLLVVGFCIKQSPKVNDGWIPWVLIWLGVGLVVLSMLAQGVPAGMEEWFGLLFNALVQGALAAAVPITGTQLVKQSGEIKNPTVSVSETDIEVAAGALGVGAKAMRAALMAAKQTTSL